LILSVMSAPLSASAQKLKKADKVTLANLQTHVRYLSDERMQGRRTGTPGEKSASDYIVSAFNQAGLQPKGNNGGWLQAFDIDEGRQVSADAYFSVNDRPFVLNKEYFPLAFSAVGVVSGSPAIALQERGVPWFLDLKELLEGAAGNAHFDLEAVIRERAASCSQKGATALILFNSSKTPDNLSYDPRVGPAAVAVIPVIYITREAKRKYLRDESADLDIKIKVGFTEKKRTGHNIAGYLDNGAANTVIIAAHYDYGGVNGGDHPGYGKENDSLKRGADDNSSGVAAIIELARLLKGSKLRGNNYLFIAFSGKEQGMYGSQYFVGHPLVNLQKVNFMLNLDMVGSLSDSSHLLTVAGVSTSPVWAGVCDKAVDKKALVVHMDNEAGAGDQAAFSRKGIPVLLFFTRMSSDYQRPADDADKINFAGEVEVLKFIYSVLQEVNARGRIAVTNTVT
jgi:aminopeptidase YwaD